MSPLPETIEAAHLIELYNPDLDILSYLQETAAAVQAFAPGCIALSASWREHQGVAFALRASGAEFTSARQSAAPQIEFQPGGTCAQVDGDVLDEHAWQAEAAAHSHEGIASTITFPLTVSDSGVVGAVTFYGNSVSTFDGGHAAVAYLIGERADSVVTNADLAFTELQAAKEAPAQLRAHAKVNQAVGTLMAEFGINADMALERLRLAASHAGVTVEDLAWTLVDRPGRDEGHG